MEVLHASDRLDRQADSGRRGGGVTVERTEAHKPLLHTVLPRAVVAEPFVARRVERRQQLVELASGRAYQQQNGVEHHTYDVFGAGCSSVWAILLRSTRSSR